ncbi:cytochrome c4 [Halomonas aquamarina]|uniref:Cytochrome c4 n=1 Tax=Vreelandella aquamarina TaxID=77097 RepID=A0ACC5VUY2_9GAMM|nr:c-type cytochrome [Halomonas aquamarina]MBZ5487581.1 cytochrome c4 [Halomonas aquamarina]
MRVVLPGLTALLTMWSVACVQADDQPTPDATAGEQRAQTCAACHGQTGISPASVFPHLAGQQASYLAKQIRDIRDGERIVPQMIGLVDDFSDQDALDVAAYYAAQEANLGQVSRENEAQLARGEALYRAGDAELGVPACSACHTPTGVGIGSAVYPALSGQYPAYTVAALQAFAAGERVNDPSGSMNDIAARLSAEDRQAVAEYLFGLH